MVALHLKKNSLLLRFLTITVYRCFDKERAEKSKFQYIDKGFGQYNLRILGILNGLFGLRVEIKE